VVVGQFLGAGMPGKPDKQRELQKGGPDWNNPFSGLIADGLPAGPTPADAAPVPTGPPARRGRVVLRRETAHRGGKTVIVIDQIPAPVSTAELGELARRLKRACGCGGTVRSRTIEVQGDQPAKVRASLEAAGFRVDGVG